MALDTVLFGELFVPSRNLEGWLCGPLVSGTFGALELLPGEDPTSNVPEGLIAELSALAVEPHELFELSREGSRLTVRAHVGQDGFLSAARPLALLFASAAQAGGSGSLVLLGTRGAAFGYRLTVGWGQVRLRGLGAVEQHQTQLSPAFRAVAQRSAQVLATLMGGVPSADGEQPFLGL
jgi:hypothetical protein